MNKENIERKYGKKVNKNGWMVRLHRFTLGREPKFIGYCPLFWSSWVLIFLFPLTLIGKLLSFCLKIFSNCCQVGSNVEPNFEWTTEKISIDPKPKKPTYREFFVLLKVRNKIGDIYDETKDYYKIYCNDARVYIEFYDYCEFISALMWVLENGGWDKCAVAFEKELKKEELAKAAKQKYQDALKKQSDLIVKFTSFLVKPALIVSAIAVAYLIYMFIGWLVSVVTFSQAISVFGIIALVFGVALCLSAIWHLCQKISATIGHVELSLGVSKKNNKLFDMVGKFFGGIGVAFKFIIETINMFYTKECPLIEWTDKDGKITNNKKN